MAIGKENRRAAPPVNSGDNRREQEAGLLIIRAVTGGDYAGDRLIISAATGGEQAVNRLIKEGFPAGAGTHLSTCSFDRKAAPGFR